VNNPVCDLDQLHVPPLRPGSLIFPKDLIFVNKFIPPFVPRRDTVMEDSLRALKDWMIDERDIPTLDPAVVMVALIITAPLMVLLAMFEDVSMSISTNVIATSP
jgi:hypothetical protein